MLTPTFPLLFINTSTLSLSNVFALFDSGVSSSSCLRFEPREGNASGSDDTGGGCAGDMKRWGGAKLCGDGIGGMKRWDDACDKIWGDMNRWGGAKFWYGAGVVTAGADTTGDGPRNRSGGRCVGVKPA